MMMMMMTSIVAGGYAGCIAPPKGHATEPASTSASSGMVDAEAGEGRVCSNSRVALPATPGDFNNSATFPAMITEDEQWFDYCAPPEVVADCIGGDYLRLGSNQGPTGGAPTAPEYSAGDGSVDYDNNRARGTISVTAGGGGGGGN